jgi:CheY-like chemotaxis protein
MIRRNVELEARLIDDLLDLTRISRGKLRMVRQVLDAHELLHACVRFVSPEIEAKGLKLSLLLDAPKRWVEADPVRLQQVFWNVLRNAVKFTPHNGSVTVRTRAHNGTLIVEVEDNGIGIPAAELVTIFEAFRQGGGGGQFGGLGLGLAITRALVEQHGGRIVAESGGEGLGSTFRLEFPHTAAPAAEQPTTDGKAVEKGRSGSSGRRILLVEDHEDTRETLQRMLVRRGHQVSPAGSLRGARALAETGEFDFVITDLGLPDGDGAELLRAFSHTAQAPIGIALTGYGMEDDIQRTLAAGFSAHLTKPIDFTELDRLLSAKG